MALNQVLPETLTCEPIAQLRATLEAGKFEFTRTGMKCEYSWDSGTVRSSHLQIHSVDAAHRAEGPLVERRRTTTGTTACGSVDATHGNTPREFGDERFTLGGNTTGRCSAATTAAAPCARSSNRR